MTLAFYIRLFILLIIWGLTNPATAQKKFTVTFKSIDGTAFPHGKIRLKPMVGDSMSAINYIKQSIRQLHSQSFLLASVDSIRFINDSITAFIQIGNSFKWANLSSGNVEEKILTGVGYREKIYRNRSFSYQQVVDIEEEILHYADDQGYPFASIQLDSIIILEHSIKASLHFSKGPYIVFDTIAIEGTAHFKSKFLSAYLKIFPGQPFSQYKVERAERLLKQLPYLSIIKPFTIEFKNDRAYPVFYVDRIKANEIDGIIGFLPNEQAQNKLLITGEMNLQLKNIFGSGKAFSLQWQQIKQSSPRLDISYEHPALLGTPLTFKGNFNMLKEDTTFLNIDRQLSFGFDAGNTGKISLFMGLKTSRLGNNVQYREANQLPIFSDFKLFYYGVGYEWNSIDNFFYTTKGVDVSINALAGNKTIIKNPFIGQELYENVHLNTIQVMLKGSINKYSRISPRSILFMGAKGGKVANANLFKNDLFRIGGLNSLRGHNENFFFASDYAVITTEYRFFMEPTSYLFLFYDQAYIRYQVQASTYEDKPLGIGAGVSFRTNVGVFQLIYALGQSKERKLGPNFSKVHFGITSRF